MKIRKVDDKPMVIHTKEKAKIHAHEPKGAKIKGSNIYTVERGPKTIGAKVSDDKKKSYRKSTIHQSEPKNKGLSRFKRNYRESNTFIKTKNTNLHIAGRTGALAVGAVTEQVEGGQEVSQAAYLAYEASRPVTGTASKGAALFRKKAAAEAKKRIKKVEAGKKLAKKTAKKAAKDTAKTVAKETAKETAKTTAKVATKTATKAAATAAGTAVAPGVGMAIGMAAGYAAGVSIEVKDEKMTNRSRKIKFFLDKMKAQENQTDSVAKLVKDLIVRKAITWVKAAAPIIGLVLLLLVLVVAMIAVPVIILTQVAIKLSGLPENRVIGSGTVLDSARLRYKLGEHLSVDSRSVHAFIVGEHGDSEVVAWSSANVSGVPLSEMCEMRGHYKHKENTAEIATAVKNSAYEIINKKHATYYGIAMSVKRICEVIMRDEKSILPVSHIIHGVYDIDGVSLSMPAIVGADGIESDIPINLSGDEALKLKESADSLKKIIETIEL